MSEIGKISIYGAASARVLKILSVDSSFKNQSLMDYLHENQIPVASSCSGDGVCKKCVVKLEEEDILSCQAILKDLFKISTSVTIRFSYL